MKVKHLEELENVLESLQIKKEDICIVGSSVLAVSGIRHNNDIDIIIAPEFRKKVTSGSQAENLSKNVECVASNWLYKFEESPSDKDIVYDSEYHFVNGDFKYCKLDLLIKRKSNSDKEKDIKDMEVINDRSKN